MTPRARRRRSCAWPCSWRYCEASAAFIFADHLVSRRTERILNALHCGALSMTQIHKLFGNNTSKAEIDQALTELQDKIRIRSGGPGGGVTVRLVGV